MFMGRKLKLDTFTIILVGILVLCAGMTIITFRTVFNAFTLSSDITTDTDANTKLNETNVNEAKNFALGQKTVTPLNIKNSSAPVATQTPKPTPKL